MADASPYQRALLAAASASQGGATTDELRRAVDELIVQLRAEGVPPRAICESLSQIAQSVVRPRVDSSSARYLAVQIICAVEEWCEETSWVTR